MSINKIKYSTLTIVSEEDNETEAKLKELVAQFDATRQDYNQEHAQLRARYAKKFKSIIDQIRVLENSR